MSQPISACIAYKAAKGDEKAWKWLVAAFRYNMKCGHYSQFPCSCTPPCQVPTQPEMDALNNRLKRWWEDEQASKQPLP